MTLAMTLKNDRQSAPLWAYILYIHLTNPEKSHRRTTFVLANLALCTLQFPYGPSPWLFLQRAFVKGHGQRPGASHWSCRISEWARGRLPRPGLMRRRCNGALDPCLSHSVSLGLSGSWTASRKAAAPSPFPCCLHAGYPTPLPFTTGTLLRHSPLDYFTALPPLLFLLWLWFSSCNRFPPKPSSPLLNLCRPLLQSIQPSSHSTWKREMRKGSKELR